MVSSVHPPPTAAPTPARVAAVWAVGVLAYLVAVLHRTSFGVAGLDAAARFDAGPAALSGFVVLQLLVYAGLQVPTGVLLDRFGARTLVVAGAVIMALGQLVLATAGSLPVAVLARVLVGAGDALTFISVLAVVSAWFPARRVPLFTQLTGQLGQLGQVLSAVPLVALLHGPGWTSAFVATAALGGVVGVAAFAVLRDRPPHAPPPPPAPSLRAVRALLAAAWREPGTRLGFWTHTGTQFAGMVFVLLWGVPYLVVVHGLSPAAAGGLLTLFVAVGVTTGPVFGEFVARHPQRRSWPTVGVLALTSGVWTTVLLVPPPAPRWLLVVLVLVLALGTPSSMVAFDYARTANPPARRGTATGIVNVGGFFATLVVALAVGVVLDLVGGGGGRGVEGSDPDAFRLAWTVQFPVWAAALAGVLISRRRARQAVDRDGSLGQ